ncbi:TonB-dependent receptor, partial [Stenotrophomonas maltophilia]
FQDKNQGLSKRYAPTDNPNQENQVGRDQPWTTEHTHKGERPGVGAGPYLPARLTARRRPGTPQRDGAMATARFSGANCSF